MTILCVKKKENSWGRVIELRCDQCNSVYTNQYGESRLKQLEEMKHSFCSKVCKYTAQKYGGLLQQAFKEKHGIDNVFAREDVKQKVKNSLFEHYGVRNPGQSVELCEKRKQTWLTKYGVDNPNKSQVIIDKTQKTCLERYGVSCAAAVSHQRGTAVLSFNKPEVRAKALESRIVRGVIFVSSLEKDFITRLKAIRGDTDVNIQVRLWKWPIDAHVLSLNLYVQFDGDHHHGINKASRSYPKVQKQMERDLEQNAYFEHENLKLLRIGSSFAKSITNDQLSNLLLEASRSLVTIKY